MNDGDAHLSTLLMERWLIDELSADEHWRAVQHLEHCSDCQQALAALERSHQDLLAGGLPVPSARVLASFEAAQLLRNVRRNETRSSPTARAALLWLPLAAAVLLGVWSLDRGSKDAQGDAVLPGVAVVSDAVRFKGAGELRMHVYVREHGRTRRASEGESVGPGAQLGFRVFAARPGYLMVLGKSDADAEPWVAFPDASAQAALDSMQRLKSLMSAPLASEPGGVDLPGAMRLDDAPGRLRTVAIWCESSFAYEEIAARWEAWTLQPDAVPGGCAVDSVTLIHDLLEAP